MSAMSERERQREPPVHHAKCNILHTRMLDSYRYNDLFNDYTSPTGSIYSALQHPTFIHSFPFQSLSGSSYLYIYQYAKADLCMHLKHHRTSSRGNNNGRPPHSKMLIIFKGLIYSNILEHYDNIVG